MQVYINLQYAVSIATAIRAQSIADADALAMNEEQLGRTMLACNSEITGAQKNAPPAVKFTTEALDAA